MIFKPNFTMVLLLITNRCNISCQHCYVSSSPKGSFGLDKNILLQLVDDIYEFLGPVRLALSGGEPLARHGDAIATLNHAAGRLPLLLLTNGTLITPKIARQLSSIEGLTIRVGLDGPDARHHDLMRGSGSFDKLMRGVTNLLSAGFPSNRLEAFATIPDRSVDFIEAILGLAASVGFNTVKIEPVAKTGRAAETWSRLPEHTADIDTLRYLDKIELMTDSRTVSMEGWLVRDIKDTRLDVLNIYSDGSVYPFTYQDSEDQQFGFLGNIHDQPLNIILDEESVSSAVTTKSIRLLRGPARSLRAVRAERVIDRK